MPESRYYRNDLQYPELHHFKLSRRSIGRTETELMNLYSKEFSNEYDARLMSFKIQEFPILTDYSKTKQLDFKAKSKFMSKMTPRSPRTNVLSDLGHDLDQLTKGNQHEVNLSPYPSLTIMVQPNKIDYTKRCKNVIDVRRL